LSSTESAETARLTKEVCVVLLASQLLEPLELPPDEVEPLEVEVPELVEVPEDPLLEDGSPELEPPFDEPPLELLLYPELFPLEVAPEVLPDEDPPPVGRSVDEGPAQSMRSQPTPSSPRVQRELNFMLAHSEQLLSSSATS
jgi:hypothetical protein